VRHMGTKQSEDDRPPAPQGESTPLPGASRGASEDSQSNQTTPLPKPTEATASACDTEEPGKGRESPLTAQSPAAAGGGAALTLTFSPNELIAGRYRIVRFIGQGGMGELYEAEDLELRERVALKTVRPEIAQDEKAIERFKREIHLARKVTHPNVCRIFDLTYHPTAEGLTLLLTMELLGGETLADRLRRAGRMTTTEAFPIITQIAAGLAAAHEAGIVHRDFKSANVVLVPSKRGAEDVRAVVTDFGLARGTSAGDSSAVSLCGTGDFAGTPAYMAPEQVRGGEITPAVDIYALGVVMYEMLTGHRPFAGDTPPWRQPLSA